MTSGESHEDDDREDKSRQCSEASLGVKRGILSALRLELATGHLPLATARRLISFILFSSLLLALDQAASAQTAELTGRVTDSHGAVIQGARLTLANLDTGAIQRTISNREGIYVTRSIDPKTSGTCVHCATPQVR